MSSFLYKNSEREGKTVLSMGLVPVGGGISCKYCVLKYEVETWVLLKLFQEWEEGGIKENDGGGEFNYDIL
jgi:hypothetical protein